MDFIEETREQLTRDELEEQWKEHIDTTIEDEDVQEDLLEWIRGLRDDFLDFMDVVQDPQEVREALVDRYIELKSHWKMLNTKMQYQAVNTGQPDPPLMVKGSLVSKLLEKIENQLGGDEVADLTEFLSNPMEILQSVRVDEDELDQFMDYVGELIVTGEMYNHLENSLAKNSIDVDADFTQNFQSTNQAFQELSSDLQDSLLEIREVTLENHLNKYPVLVRKLIEETDRDVEVDLSGEDISIDSKLIEILERPLTALVQYFALEDIKPADEREEAGKDPQGTIQISVDQSGDEVVFEVSSDGQGFDLNILQGALAGEAEDFERSNYANKEILRTILKIGLETRDNDDKETSSNGQEMIDRIEDVRGSIEFQENDEGFTIRISIPRTQSVVVVEGLLIRAADQQFIVPLESVIETLSLEKVPTTTVEDHKEAINLRGDIFPLHDLSSLLNLQEPDDTEATKPMVMVLEEGGMEYSLKVDEVVGQQKVVVRDLGPVFEQIDFTSGSALMGDGSICLVLDVRELVSDI
ncbi:MAG: chemotaxis protein CheW [bacterium]